MLTTIIYLIVKRKRHLTKTYWANTLKNYLNAKLEILKWSNLTILKHRQNCLELVRNRKLLK